MGGAGSPDDSTPSWHHASVRGQQVRYGRDRACTLWDGYCCVPNST
ncbi:hypothetical protein P9A48_gp25 [Xanthomonas phage Mallos]|uniref:Uncharacterized protein n=1 Tax=Xanthomonas phage Mallos TaxID=2939131 RepID=A0A9E7E1Q8_9CAUD|nr:hypothetical protein P9A48_gp25 [Xanthomonas phage Mallos]URA07133.1 hypothetical protein Mallos_BL60025 [Xanthomonas phage Mallos]